MLRLLILLILTLAAGTAMGAYYTEDYARALFFTLLTLNLYMLPVEVFLIRMRPPTAFVRVLHSLSTLAFIGAMLVGLLPNTGYRLATVLLVASIVTSTFLMRQSALHMVVVQIGDKGEEDDQLEDPHTTIQG